MAAFATSYKRLFLIFSTFVILRLHYTAFDYCLQCASYILATESITTMEQILLLSLAGLLSGVINSIAGGGGILLYPALLVTGLPPIMANATSSLVILPGSVSSAYGYRKELGKVPRSYIWLAVPCLIGSVIGCYILVNTAPSTFEKLAPWLVLSAVMLLALQTKLHHWLSKQSRRRKIHWHTLPIICVLLFPLAIYGGFFGVGFGLMMLALLGFSSLKNTLQMNGVKNLASIVMASVATIYFVSSGLINWRAGLIMAAGNAVGGYAGARLAHKISAHHVHTLTIAIGLIISIVLIVKS